MGKIKILEEETARFWSKVNILSIDECWEWRGGVNQDGYGSFYTNNTHVFAHRFSWVSTFGEITAPEIRVLHKCDNPPCANPNHLFLGTQLDNIKDRDSKGRHADASGVKNGRAVLKESDVIEIKRMRQKGVAYKEIARRKGVSEGCVNHILNGRHWSWVE